MHQEQIYADDRETLGRKYLAILEVLEKYYDALYRCDTELLSQVFHPSAQYFTASSGELLHLDMKSYFPIVKQRISPKSSGFLSGSKESPAKSNSLGSSRCDGLALVRARNMTCRRPGLFFSH